LKSEREYFKKELDSKQIENENLTKEIDSLRQTLLKQKFDLPKPITKPNT